MKRPPLAGLWVLLMCWSVPLRAELSSDIHALIQDKAFAKAEIGIEVLTLGSKAGDSKVLFRHNSDIPLMPASNLKLVTTSAAMERLGPHFKFHTVLARHGNDLWLIGDGDPTLGDGDAMKRIGWDVTTVFRQWIDVLKKQNLSQIDNVYVDDSVFDQTFYHPSWDPGQYLDWYRAEVAGMNLNLNLLDFYVHGGAPGQLAEYRLDPPTHYASVVNRAVSGNDNTIGFARDRNANNLTIRGEAARGNAESEIEVTIHDPPLYAACAFAELCKAAGIHVNGKVARDRQLRSKLNQPDVQVAAVYETPLQNVLARANKDSINLYAECLCKRLGAAATGQSGSWENGTAVMKDFLQNSVHVSAAEYKIDDGCGLSREDGVSANTLCRVLAYDWAGPNREAFVSSMAIGGVDGKTLKKRFTDDLKGRVFAKTGYIRGVSCLSGFLRLKDEQTLAFSVLVNEIYTDDARKLQDSVVRAIDRNAVVRSTSVNP